jgi:serine/threonine-protein kinase
MPIVPERLAEALSDRYPIQRELGSGGMATVYLAHDLKHDRPVALKVLRPDYAATVGPERFLREIDTAAKLTHPHILPLHDSGAANGFLYYVMPYVEGESLRDRLKREKQLEVEDAVEIARQVADALSYAHRHGVIHRDIKPENILLEEGEAVVADFGIARAITAAAGGTLTDTGIAIGTPHYMSPEQGLGERNLDARTDIYALGCVLYEMLAGQPPFTGPSVEVIISRHVTEHPPSLQAVRKEAPPWLVSIVDTALAKIPADRYADAASLSQALITQSVPPLWQRLWRRLARSSRRRRLTFAMAIALAAVFVVTVKWLNLRIERGRIPPVSTSAELDAKSIAVLYFEDHSDDGSLGDQARALTEGLIDMLAAGTTLDVESRHASAVFAGKPVTMDSIGRTLEVATIIDGTVEPLDRVWSWQQDRLRVTIRFADGSSGQQFEMVQIDEASDAPLRLLARLVNELTRRLRWRIGEPITLAEQQDAASNDDAYRLFHQAKKLREDAHDLSREDVLAASLTYDRADSLLAEAEKLDRDWLAPTLERGWIASSQSILALQASPDSIDREARFHDWIDWGIAHSERVLDRRPDFPKALELRGALRFRCFRHGGHVPADTLRDAALRDLLAATTADPKLVSAWITLSEVYESMGSESLADRAAERAADVDLWAIAADYEDALIRLYQRAMARENYEQARERCEAGTGYDHPNLTNCELAILGNLGSRPEEIPQAWRLFERDMVPPNQQLPRYFWVAAVIARAGLADSALHVTERARENVSDEDVLENLAPMDAWVRTVAGDHDTAVNLLTDFLKKNPEKRSEIANHRWFRPLHAHPGFRTLRTER